MNHDLNKLEREFHLYLGHIRYLVRKSLSITIKSITSKDNGNTFINKDYRATKK